VEQTNIEPIKLTIWSVAKYACRGVPVSVKHLDRPWKEVLTPRFPLFFSLLPLLTVVVVGSIVGEWRTGDVYVPKDEFIIVRILGFVEAIPYSIIAFTVLYSWVPFVVNLLLLGWCFFILSVFKRITNEDIQVAQGAKRVVYFSAFFQFLLFSVFFCLPGFLVDPHFALTVRSVVFWLVTSTAAIIRIMSLFQGMRREANRNVFVGFLSVIPCIDAWYALANLILLIHLTMAL